MGVAHIFAPKNKPVGNLPIPYSANTWLGAEWDEFKRGDMPMLSGRNQIVQQGNRKLLRNELRDTDNSGYGNFCMNQFWRGDAHGGMWANGSTVGCVFGMMLDANFPTPPAWMVGWEIHTPWDSPAGYYSPMTALTFDNGVLRIRNNASGGDTWQGGYERGRMQYFAVEVVLKTAGVTKVWHSLDTPPDITKPPSGVRNGETVPPSGTAGSYSKLGQYRSKGSSGMTHLAFYEGYAEAASIAEAMNMFKASVYQNGGGGTPPPQMSISSSIKEGATLKGSLPWTATVQNGTPASVTFLIDGVIKHTENVSPYEYGGDGGSLDTTTLSEGAHVLRVQTDTGVRDTANVLVDNVTAPPPDPCQPKLDTLKQMLQEEWDVFMENKTGNRNQWTQDQKWRADNPGEFQKLQDYRAGGVRPTLSTEPGRRMLQHIDAEREIG